MVKRYGEDAAIQAGMRADELLVEGGIGGAATWLAITRAIEKLQRARREDEPGAVNYPAARLLNACDPWSWSAHGPPGIAQPPVAGYLHPATQSRPSP
jgi:hypothetical protein